MSVAIVVSYFPPRAVTREIKRDSGVLTPPDILLRNQYTSGPQDKFIKSSDIKDTLRSGDGRPTCSAIVRGNQAFS